MSFESFSRLNVLLNTISGYTLPFTSVKEKGSIVLTFYVVLNWIFYVAYILGCISGTQFVTKGTVLRDATINMLVCVEVFILGFHLYRKTNVLRELIGKFESLLVGNVDLRKCVEKAIQQLSFAFKIYVASTIASLVILSCLPFTKVFTQDQFFYKDFFVPFIISNEPFSIYIFTCGNIFILLGVQVVIWKKLCLDIYMSHIVLLLVGCYKYLKIEIAKAIEIFSEPYVTLSKFDIKCDIHKKLRMVINHHGIIVQMSVLLKQIFSFNVGVLYMTFVFRLCFSAFMIIYIEASETAFFERGAIMIYVAGVLLQMYMICFCMQQLLDASRAVSHGVYDEQWYNCIPELGNVLKTFVACNKLESRLTYIADVDLTMPCFASIIQHAYTACLFFLKIK
ncbi:odorant receptor 67a-like [Prorops nasuta]|uniref:odorant receptor 67a-like n=1 Tax=Prorops nasuta TaxID=863751 RepID=UPI0034CDC7F2